MTFTGGQLGALAFFNNINDAWTSYSPVLSTGTLGNGTIAGRFKTIGKTCVAQVHYTHGSTSTMGSGPTISLPATSFAGIIQSGHGLAHDISTGLTYTVAVMLGTSASVAGLYPTGTTGLTSVVPFTWAFNDRLILDITYETA